MAENRNEELLEAILNAGTVDEVPQSRMEKIWQYALGATIELDIPQSRLESLAILVAEQVRNGGGGITPTGTINITANGTFNVARYANAAVAVHDIEDEMVEVSLSGLYVNERVTTVGVHALYGNWRTQVSNSGLSLPNVTSVLGSGVYGGTYLESVYLPKVQTLSAAAFRSCRNLVAFIMSDITEPPTVENTNVFQDTAIASGTGYIYVPNDLVDQCKAQTNLSTYASQIKGMSECPQQYKTLYGIA